MLVKQPSPDQRIIDCLLNDYGITVVRLIFLPLGADMDVSVYKAVAQNQTSYFVKLKYGQHQDLTTTIMELLYNAGIQQVIPPLKTIRGQPIQRIEDFTLIVYPFIEGQDGFSRTLSDDQWLILGKTLRQIHDIEVPTSIKDQIRREAYSSKWRDLVRSFYTHMESEFVGDKIALELLAFMQEKSLAIHRLVDRAEYLAQIIQNESNKFVLCHADIHGGNVLLDQNNTLYIVDWDDPIMAPKERDLMFIGGGVGNIWNKPHEEALFYEGYGETEINRTILAYYRHERIVEDIALYCQSLLLTTGGGNRPEIFKHFKDMFEPMGVVDIAFKTDEGLGP